MTEQQLSKVKAKTKPTLVVIGTRTMISTGRWNADLMADYILENGRDKWLSVGHLARVGCGSNTLPTKKRVRTKLSSLFTHFCERGEFLAVEYGGNHNAAMSVKVADLNAASDHQSVVLKLERMRKHKELTQDQYERFTALLHVKEQ